MASLFCSGALATHRCRREAAAAAEAQWLELLHGQQLVGLEAQLRAPLGSVAVVLHLLSAAGAAAPAESSTGKRFWTELPHDRNASKESLQVIDVVHHGVEGQDIKRCFLACMRFRC